MESVYYVGMDVHKDSIRYQYPLQRQNLLRFFLMKGYDLF
jgi:hypothetical protein